MPRTMRCARRRSRVVHQQPVEACRPRRSGTRVNTSRMISTRSSGVNSGFFSGVDQHRDEDALEEARARAG